MEEPKVFYSQSYISADHPDLEGHFPGHPIFPAVSQIALVIGLLRSSFAQPIQASCVKRAKFKAILRPDTLVDIEVTLLSAKQARWILRDSAQVYSTGDLTLNLPSH